MNRTTDWYDVREFGAGDYRIVEAPRTLPCYLYLLRGSDDALLIDSGAGVGNLRQTVGDLVTTDVRLLLTHTHWDHIGAGSQFERVAVHPRERTDDGRVTIDSLSDEFVQRPAQFVEDHLEAGEPFPDEFDPESFSVSPMSNVQAVEGGETLNLGERRLEIVDIPGHAPGQLGVIDRAEDVFYGADLVHSDQNMYVHFEYSDIREYIKSLKRVVDLRDGGAFSTLATAHNPPLYDDELGVLDSHLALLRNIVEGKLEPTTVETTWGPANKYTEGDTEVLTKTSV